MKMRSTVSGGSALHAFNYLTTERRRDRFCKSLCRESLQALKSSGPFNVRSLPAFLSRR
jgi:hypothetical protein